LLASALALGSAFSSDADPEIGDIPDDTSTEELFDAVEHADVLGPARERALERLARDHRVAIRSKVAEAAGRLWQDAPSYGLNLLRELANDPLPDVRAAATRGLAYFLDRAPVALRASTESEWAEASSVRERLAVARALGMARHDWLTDLAIQQLALDPNGQVRLAALVGADAHLATDLSSYAQLALSHVSDRDRNVRKAARRLVERAQQLGWADPRDARARRADRQRFRRAMRGDLGPRVA
jgi:hypothetical protein